MVVARGRGAYFVYLMGMSNGPSRRFFCGRLGASLDDFAL